jgi:phage tail-like protein
MTPREIENLLPWVIRRTATPGSPLAGLLAAMAGLHAPAERVLEQVEVAFDPRRAADAFVPFLARWVDLGRLLEDERLAADLARPLLPSGLGRLRELVAAAAELSQQRGTGPGLLRFLTVATGCRGFRLEEQPPGLDGRPRPFHLRVLAPAEALPYRALVERIVALEKPAYVTSEVVFDADAAPGEEERAEN